MQSVHFDERNTVRPRLESSAAEGLVGALVTRAGEDLAGEWGRLSVPRSPPSPSWLSSPPPESQLGGADHSRSLRPARLYLPQMRVTLVKPAQMKTMSPSATNSAITLGSFTPRLQSGIFWLTILVHEKWLPNLIWCKIIEEWTPLNIIETMSFS